MSRVWMCHVNIYETCHTYEWGMSRWWVHVHTWMSHVTRKTLVLRVCSKYGVASDSRIDKIIGLFCKRALQKRLYSAKETYNLIDPTHHSNPILSRTHLRDWRRFMNCMSNAGIIHVNVNESCNMYEWGMSRIRMSHVTYKTLGWKVCSR